MRTLPVQPPRRGDGTRDAIHQFPLVTGGYRHLPRWGRKNRGNGVGSIFPVCLLQKLSWKKSAGEGILPQTLAAIDAVIVFGRYRTVAGGAGGDLLGFYAAIELAIAQIDIGYDIAQVVIGIAVGALEQEPESFVEHEEAFDVAFHELNLSRGILRFFSGVLGIARGFGGDGVGVGSEEEVVHGWSLSGMGRGVNRRNQASTPSRGMKSRRGYPWRLG
jgi:hypothetical protein